MLHAIRKMLFVLGCCLFGAVVAVFSEPPKGSPDGLWHFVGSLGAHLHPTFGRFLFSAGEGLWTTGHWAVQHPIGLGVIFALVAIPTLISLLIRMIPRSIAKDPVRLFTSDQRRIGGERAEGRCEMEGIFFTRCRWRGDGGHGDHWFPHSKGGSTSMSNFVWACPRCNMSKGAKIPTFWETTRLEWRRRSYFPTSEPARPFGKVRA